MKKKSTYLIAALLLPVTAVTLGASPASAESACEIVPWGSLDKGSSVVVGGSVVTNVRSGQHDCFDRIVIDIDGNSVDFSARYTSELVADGSGDITALAGNAFLEVRVAGVVYDFETGEIVYNPDNQLSVTDVTNYQALRQVALVSSFEGQTQFGIGTRGRLPFRTFTLEDHYSGTSRLVIDIAHSW